MPTPIDPREEVVNGVWMYTYDPPDDVLDDALGLVVEEEVRREQDNDFAGEEMADLWDFGDID